MKWTECVTILYRLLATVMKVPSVSRFLWVDPMSLFHEWSLTMAFFHPSKSFPLLFNSANEAVSITGYILVLLSTSRYSPICFSGQLRNSADLCIMTYSQSKWSARPSELMIIIIAFRDSGEARAEASSILDSKVHMDGRARYYGPYNVVNTFVSRNNS